MTIATKISKGIELIVQYEEDAYFTAEHDVVFCGQGNGRSITEITDEGKDILEELGWFIDEGLGCWSRYV